MREDQVLKSINKRCTGGQLCKVILSFLICLAPLSTSFAQDNPQKAQMTAVGEQAMEKFQTGDFEAAAGKFEEAYDIYPEVVLLKNATIAWFSAGVCDSAERTGLKYLELTTEEQRELSKDRRDVKTVIARCRIRAAKVYLNNDDLDNARKSLDGIELFSPEEDDALALIQVRKSIDAKQKELDANKSTPSSGDAKADDDSSATKKKDNGLLYAGVAATSVGAAGLGLTALLVTRPGVRASNQWYSDGCNGTGQNIDVEECDALYKKAESASNNELILYSLSGTVAAAGVGLIIWHVVRSNKEKESSSLILVPDVGPERAGANVMFSF